MRRTAELVLGRAGRSSKWTNMKTLLIVAVSPICAASSHAQDQPNATKLKADAERVVSIISGDKTKSQIYCQIANLGNEIDQEKDRNKAEVMFRKMEIGDTARSNTSLLWKPLRTWIQDPKKARTSSRSLMSWMRLVQIRAGPHCSFPRWRSTARPGTALREIIFFD
jgi:hypothetical protein